MKLITKERLRELLIAEAFVTACKYSLWWSNIAYECLCNNKGYIRRWLYLEDLLPK